MTARLDRLHIEGLRSVRDCISLQLPSTGPLVLLGENNAGKSNIVKGLDILFGDRWPKSFEPEGHDYFDRDRATVLKLGAHVSGLSCANEKCTAETNYIRWKFDRDAESPCTYEFGTHEEWCRHTWPSAAWRSELFAMVVGADRRISYEMSYASRWTFLSRLMHRFHERLVDDEARVKTLESIFSSLLRQFEEVEEFRAFQELLTSTADLFGQNLPYRLDLDFSAYDPSNFFKSLRVHPTVDGGVRSFDELGTGQEQILALAFSYAYAKAFRGQAGLILVIDEPESHLHPLAQRWLADRLDDLTDGTLQVVLTTHSPHFVDLAKLENLVMVRKDDDGATRARQVSRDEAVRRLLETGADAARTNATTVGPFYAASATADVVTGLFSRLAVLVEGPTEAMAIPELLKCVGFDALRAGVDFVPVGGLGNLAKWLRLYCILGVPVYCMHDTDSNRIGTSNGETLQQQRHDIANALGLSDITMSDEPLHVKERFATFDKDFEAGVSALFVEGRWRAEYDAAADIVGESSKPLRARYAARRLGERDLSELGVETLSALAHNLTALVHGPQSVARA